MPITKLPGIVACTGAIVVVSENSNPEALLMLKLRTEAGDQVLLPLSERTTRQLQLVISEFNRTRDLLFVDDESRALEEGVAAAMVGMQVRADYDIDVIGRDTDRLESIHHVHTLRHHRRHDAHEFAPARFRIFRHRWMAAGVEQYIPLAVPQQHA